MTTRACDFSSFRRPLRPSNNTSVTNSPQSTTGRSDSTAQNLQNPTVENQSSHTTSSTTMNSNARRLMASHSVGPSARPSNYDYLSGSIPRFHGVSSPSMSSFSPNPTTTFSSQNLEQFSSYDRRPSKAINHSTIDRSTLPYDRKQSTPDESERSNNLSRQEERSSGSGSGLVFLDGGKRGVMSADSQHSLNGSLSGHRMDRSLAHRQHSAVNNMKDSFEYDGGYDTHPRQQRNDVMHQYNSVQRYHAGQYQPDHSAYMDDGQRGGYVGNNDNEIIGNYNSVGGAIMSQSPYVNNVMSSRHHNVIRGSPHNVSSGESGIAGCDFNTLGARSYDTYAGGAVDSPAGYAAAVSSTHGRYASVGGRLASNSSAAMHAVSQPDNQTGIYDPHQQHSQLQYAAGSQGSNGSNRSSNTAESSLTARGDCNQQTLLIPSGSALRLNTSADESVTVYDHSHPFSFSPYQQQQQQQTSSVPKINTRVPSRRSQNKGFNLFKKGKKRDKRADDIYTKNNLYAPSGKKSSQVTLGSAGATTTGLSFSAKYTGAMKRPFCPRWQCIALAAAVGIAFLLCIGMVIYFYVWPSVLQPLVESSKPVDGEWGEWTPWFQCSATCGQGNQHRTRECNSPSPEDGGRECVGLKNEMRNCSAPVECPDCTRVCTVGTLSNDCRQCTCEGHVITGRILDEYGDPLPGVKVYKNTGAALLLSGTDNNGEFRFEGVCSNGDNELKLVKEMYRVSIVTPTQQESDEKAGYVLFTMIKLYLPHFITSPESQQRLVGQKVVLCCEAQSEQPPTKYVWYKDNTKLDPAVYKYSLQQTSLALPNLADWENGDYTCEVHNEAGVVNSKPATLTVYRNWTDLCHPTPADKFISLPDGCSQRTFNTGTCAKDIPVSTTESSSTVVTGGYHPQCISRDQYPSNEDDNTCPVKNDASRYCCKPLQEKEISVSCTLKEIGQPYNMALKRIVSCGCVLC